MSRIFQIAAAILVASTPLASAREPESAQIIQELANGIADKAPPTYFALATELFREGQKQEAAFWYYVGLIRYRAWILAKGKEAEATDEPYHFSVLNQSVGQSIYQHADRDSAALIRAIDRALAWDLEQPNGFTSKDAFKAQYERARQEVLELRYRIKTDPAALKTTLAGSGMISW